MSDREPTDITLKSLGIADQRMTEINATAAQTAFYYRVLVSNGIPEMPAAQMANMYNAMMLMRHFGVENHGGYMNFFFGGGSGGGGASE